MVTIHADARHSQLAQLDVIDVAPDGTLAPNAAFVAECRAAYAADTSSIDTVIGAHILKRALAGELVIDLDLDALTLALLEIDSTDGVVSA